MHSLKTTMCFGFLTVATPALASDKINSETCKFNGFPLYGDIQIVESFPDIKVQIVESFPDLKVEVVESFADDCGQWKFVTSFPDVKIQYVESFPDIKIKMVTSFPGLP
ncbi:MAG: hypothetical protein HKN14_02675 [Marinicaulis sp.]|nr:hypothetical protein [Marinicaulis sp.]NNL90076.1 hypothetical protein [Marinicaulis sp.]